MHIIQHLKMDWKWSHHIQHAKHLQRAAWAGFLLCLDAHIYIQSEVCHRTTVAELGTNHVVILIASLGYLTRGATQTPNAQRLRDCTRTNTTHGRVSQPPTAPRVKGETNDTGKSKGQKQENKKFNKEIKHNPIISVKKTKQNLMTVQ